MNILCRVYELEKALAELIDECEAYEPDVLGAAAQARKVLGTNDIIASEKYKEENNLSAELSFIVRNIHLINYSPFAPFYATVKTSYDDPDHPYGQWSAKVDKGFYIYFMSDLAPKLKSKESFELFIGPVKIAKGIVK